MVSKPANTMKLINTAIKKAITWLFDMEEANNPIAVKAPHKKSKPMYEPMMAPVSILFFITDKLAKVITYNTVGKIAKITINEEAKNLPKIISLSFNGSVNNTSIVPALYSSEKERMVKAGIKNNNIHGAKAKNLSIEAYPKSSILLSGATHKKKPQIIKKTTMAI